MDLMIKNYVERAKNELVLAEALKKMSEDADSKKFFEINQEMTFYFSSQKPKGFYI